jgi:hypothetical protein
MKHPPGVSAEGMLGFVLSEEYSLRCVQAVRIVAAVARIVAACFRPVADDFDEVLSPPFTEQTPEEDRSQEPCGRQAWINASIPPHIWVEPRPKSTRLPPRCLLQSSGFTTFAGGQRNGDERRR